MQIVDILSLLVPNVWTALTQLCASAVLFFLMYKLAWKPVKKILDTRSEFEQVKLAEAERLIEENEKKYSEAKDIISDANRTAEEIVADATKEAQKVREDLLAETKKECELILANNQKDLELQKSKMLKEVQEELVDATISATEKMLKNKIDYKTEKDNIDSFIKEVINQ